MTGNNSSASFKMLQDPFDKVCSAATQPVLVVYTIFLVLIMAATIFGNALVITAVYLSHRLRRMTNFFIVSLAVSDLLVGLVHLPLRIDLSVHNFNWCFDRTSGVVTTCAYWIVMDSVFSSASICNLVVISIDRFLVITKPYEYQSRMTKPVGLSLIAAVWVYAMLWGTLGLVDWSGSTDDPHINVYYSDIGERVCGKKDRVYYTVAMAVAFFLPLLVVIVAYSCVFRVAFIQAKAVASLDPNKNQRRILRELKATKTIAIVIGCFIVCWLPFFILTVISLWCTKCMQPFVANQALSYSVRILFVFVLPIINSSLNPLIYTVFNKEFRNAFKKMLCRGRAAAGDTIEDVSVTEATNSRFNATRNSRTKSWISMNGRSSQEQRENAAAWTSSWMSRAPSTPSSPRMVGPVCWLQLGPPPALSPAGCYVYGTVGTGKSTVMDLFCLTALKGWRAQRQHFHEFSLWMHQELHSMRRANSEPQRHILERLADKVSKSCDLLCLDEFSITNVADAAILAELLQLLAVRHVAVVCTTNRPPEDLYKEGLHRERYVPALVAHLREKFLVQGVLGADYRAAMYHADRAKQDTVCAAQNDRTLFEGGSAEEALKVIPEELNPGNLKISWNRQLAIPGQSNGFAQFHFDDLCQKPLAAEDFLIIASNFHTVFLHDVPKLTLEEHNEARRFTNLVDALYEHSVRLICHCQGRLEEVLQNIQVLQGASEEDGNLDADSLGIFETMYDDSPNFQIQIKELGRDKWAQIQEQRRAEEQRSHAKRLQRLSNVDAVEGDTGSGWSAAPAGADLSAPDQGVAGVMVAAVGSLQESGFAARRATSRLKEMQTAAYLEAASRRRESMQSTTL